jgi:hypothetical protein
MEDVMRGKGFNLVSIVAGAFAAFAATGNANATCAANAAGVWHFFAITDREPAITTVVTNVRNSADNGTTQLRVFPGTGVTFANDSARVLKCVLTIAANGNFSNAPCTSIGVKNGTHTVNVSGHIGLSACNLSGTISVPGDSLVTIQGGHVNGVMGAGIAIQGAKQVLSFTLVRN